MGTGISDPTVTCNFCNGDYQVVDVADRTWQQWQCPNCGSWNDWSTVTPPGSDRAAAKAANLGLMYGVPLSWKKLVDELPITRFDVAPAPGMGKSKTLRKAMKKLNKKRKKTGLPKLKQTIWDWGRDMPHDLLTGYLVPPVTGCIPQPPVTHASNETPPAKFTNFLNEFITKTATARNAPTAEHEEKSPVWYIENWLMQREEYDTLLNQQIETSDPNVVQAHTTACDEALVELQAAEAAVNNLFKR